MYKVEKTPAEWKKILTPLQYDVTRRQGTERPFSGEYVNNHLKGVYKCACCGLDLFSSEDKFDSGTGWPSFTKPIDKANIAYLTDESLLLTRVEARCPRCGARLIRCVPYSLRSTLSAGTRLVLPTTFYSGRSSGRAPCRR